jgi:hypothetical protein
LQLTAKKIKKQQQELQDIFGYNEEKFKPN